MIKTPRSRVIIALLAVYLFWGSSYLASRIGVLALPPFLFGGVRLTVAGLVMLAIAALLTQRVRPASREWRDLLLLALIGWQMLLGGTGLLLLGVISGELPRWHWSAAGGGALLFQIAFSSCIAHTAYAWLARRVTPTLIGTYGYVNPVVAALLGWWLLGETFDLRQFSGMALALTGVALITWRPRAFTAGES